MSTQPNPELYAHWHEEKRNEIIANWNNRQVGSRIVSETEGLRIWHLVLQPGERAPFHRHDETYFWTTMDVGKSRSHYHDGSIKDTDYKPGDTMHFDLREGVFFVHDLENIGDTPLSFVTVEFKY
jgi:mannose-6-phosphate isomerase-like protein (cupin superfamily)